MKTGSYASTRYLSFGDSALLIEFGEAISLELNRKVVALDEAILKAEVQEVEELVPTYRSLLIRYNPLRTSYEQLVFRIREIEEKLTESATEVEGRRVTVPVVYGGEYGPDLNYVARYHGLTEEQVVKLHSEREYRVYMIGFVAGFPYLGEVPDEISTPRLETPRLKVPAGSVGIAEKQTGAYPREAPGGWQIIGRTPLNLFNPLWQPPALLEPGATVKFEPISEEEFKTIKESVLKGATMPFSEE
jgi:KipI family sensor histidine kinase inhibitor